MFGDPHYKTFDGKFFSFKGSCKYQLTADCYNHTFSIRVTNEARNTRASAWTKTVTLKLGSLKVNLGQKMRVKVNGTRIIPPYQLGTKLNIYSDENGVTVDTDIGIKLLWDGNNYLQVQAAATFKKKLCGLCGNYNSVWRDDLISRRGENFPDDEVWRFANSWKVGGPKACARKYDNLEKSTPCRHKKGNANVCKPLKESEVFEACGSRLNPLNYFDACKKDMCECPKGKCYCDSFSAFARECTRLGVKLYDWKRRTGCDQDVWHPTIPTTIFWKKQHNYTQKRNRKKTKEPDFLDKHIPKTFLIHKHGRTPPPLH